MILGQLMPAARAELVRSPHRPEAVPATRRKLIAALRTEMEFVLYMCSASRASRSNRQPQQKIQDRADPSRQHETDHHPESRAHRAARSVPADITHHQEVKRSQQTPRQVEVDPQAQRRRGMVPRRRQNKPPVIFNNNKRDAGRDHRPYGDQPCVFVQRNRLWIAHKRAPKGASDYPCKSTVTDVQQWQEVAIFRLGREIFVRLKSAGCKSAVRYRTYRACRFPSCGSRRAIYDRWRHQPAMSAAPNRVEQTMHAQMLNWLPGSPRCSPAIKLSVASQTSGAMSSRNSTAMPKATALARLLSCFCS